MSSSNVVVKTVHAMKLKKKLYMLSRRESVLVCFSELILDRSIPDSVPELLGSLKCFSEIFRNVDIVKVKSGSISVILFVQKQITQFLTLIAYY
jgi:hypothetical protein